MSTAIKFLNWDINIFEFFKSKFEKILYRFWKKKTFNFTKTARHFKKWTSRSNHNLNFIYFRNQTTFEKFKKNVRIKRNNLNCHQCNDSNDINNYDANNARIILEIIKIAKIPKSSKIVRENQHKWWNRKMKFFWHWVFWFQLWWKIHENKKFNDIHEKKHFLSKCACLCRKNKKDDHRVKIKNDSTKFVNLFKK